METALDPKTRSPDARKEERSGHGIGAVVVCGLRDVTTVDGCDVTLSCVVLGRPTPGVRWYINGKVLHSTSSGTDGDKSEGVATCYDGRTATLHIQDVTRHQSGFSYTCIAYNRHGQDTTSATLLVKRSNEDCVKGSGVRFIESLQDCHAAIGQTVHLTVKLSGTRPYEVTWVHNESEVGLDELTDDNCKMKYVRTDDCDGRYTLTLHNVGERQSGLYVCEAHNKFGYAESLCTIAVSDKNQNFLHGDLEQNMAEGENGNESHLQADDAEIGSAQKINKENENHLKRESSPTSVNDDKSESSRNYIEITEELKDVLVDEGDDLFLRCGFVTSKVCQDDDIDVTWYKDGKAIEQSDSIDISVVHNKENPEILDRMAVLQMKDVAFDDVTFTCQIRSRLLSSGTLSSSAKVQVKNKTTDGPVITKGPQSKTVLRGEKVILRTQFKCTCDVTVTWMKGGKEVLANDRIEMDVYDTSAVLSINDVCADDSGKYVVSITPVSENNNDGNTSVAMATHFASLAVEGVPEPPLEAPQVCNVNDTSVTLSWYGSTYDGGTIITGYSVHACESLTGSEDDWTTLVSQWHSTSYVVQGLKSGTHYKFRVTAQNVHGTSRPSKESIPVATLLKPLPPKQPKAKPNAKKVEVCVENSFSDTFDLKEELGRGRFGTVFRVIEKSSGEQRAAKFIKCFKAKDRAKVQEEIDIMNELRHSKLLLLEAAYNDNQRQFIMVLEYIGGGELFERVVAEDFTLTEKDAILFMQQICDGVSYMHQKLIMHLDLKPENILCTSNSSHQIKIIDFGLARRYDPSVETRVLFGTPEFIAPEIINYEPISPASDMWSIGVICYVLLSGLSPFMGENDAETFANITKSQYDFDEESFVTVTDLAKKFISLLLDKNQTKRLTSAECLRHEWLAQKPRSMSNVALPTDKLKKFVLTRKWHKTGNAIRALSRMAQMCGRGPLSNSSSDNVATKNTSTVHNIRMVGIKEEDTDSGNESISSVDDCNPLPKCDDKLRKALLRKRFRESSSSSGDSIDIPK